MLNGRVRADGLETAVVVGKHQTIGRNDYTRAEAAKVNHAVLNGIVAIIECAVRQLKILLLHGLINGIGQIVKCPHAFVGLSTCKAACSK